MTLADVRGLYDYTEWANERMLAALEMLSDEQYSRELVSSFPSVRDTMAHIAGAEWLWLQRWQGISPTAIPAWAERPAVGVLRRELREVAEARGEYFDGLDEAALQRPLSYRRIDGSAHTNRLLDVLLHVSNHSTYHRGQLTTMLRQLGAVPPTTDLIFYRRQ